MSYKTSILPSVIDIVQETSVKFYNNGTNILTAIENYIAELNQYIALEQGKVSTDMLQSMGNLFNTLNATSFIVPNYTSDGTPAGVKQMDNLFKLSFIEKYQSLSSDYKQKVDSLIQGNVFFKQFSDDIGILTDSVTIMDGNVNPYYDTYDKTYFLPINLPATLVNKVSKNELTICKTFSFYSDPLIKRNLNGLISPLANKFTAKTSHGTNLITDVLYYDRVYLYQISILSTLKAILGNLSSFVLFFKQINPKDQDPDRSAMFFKYTNKDLEGLTVKIDILKNLLNKTQISTLQTLGYPT